MEPLKPHQIVGRDFLASRTRALLADEPGVQKTRQAIAALDECGATSVLVVCPAIGRVHWEREFQRWGSERVKAMPRRIVSYGDATNPSIWKRITFDTPMWDVLILDEVHYAKNPFAKRTGGVFAKGGVAWHAGRIWALSGTPSPNNPAELWVLLRAFNVCPYEYVDFVERFCVVDREGHIRGTRKANLPELRRMLLPITLRRTMAEVMPELGEITMNELAVAPDKRWLDKEPPRPELFDSSLSIARRYTALLKAPAVYDILKFELQNDLIDKLVVFGYHVEPLQRMWEQAKKDGIASEIITGATPDRERFAAIDRFNLRSRVIFANIIAAGQVINLSAAHHGIMLELDWVPGNNAQAMQRMRRAPQAKPISIRIAIDVESPTDEIISRVVERKTLDILQLWRD